MPLNATACAQHHLCSAHPGPHWQGAMVTTLAARASSHIAESMSPVDAMRGEAGWVEATQAAD